MFVIEGKKEIKSIRPETQKLLKLWSLENDIGISRNSKGRRRSLVMGTEDKKCGVNGAEIPTV